MTTVKKPRASRAKKTAPQASAATPPAMTPAEKIASLVQENKRLADVVSKASDTQVRLIQQRDAAEGRCKGLDRLTIGERDMVRSQAMAMLASDTKEGAAMAAGLVFSTVGEDLIVQAVMDMASKIIGIGSAVAKKAQDASWSYAVVETLMPLVMPLVTGAGRASAPTTASPGGKSP
jgi:flagellar biosynthesis/type III secretory pathway protein FliH